MLNGRRQHFLHPRFPCALSLSPQVGAFFVAFAFVVSPHCLQSAQCQRSGKWQRWYRCPGQSPDQNTSLSLSDCFWHDVVRLYVRTVSCGVLVRYCLVEVVSVAPQHWCYPSHQEARHGRLAVANFGAYCFSILTNRCDFRRRSFMSSGVFFPYPPCPPLLPRPFSSQLD